LKQQLENIGRMTGVGLSPETQRQIRQAAWGDGWIAKMQIAVRLDEDQCKWLRLLILDVAATKAQTTLFSTSQMLDRLTSSIEGQIMQGYGWDELVKMIGDYKTFVENPSFMPQMPELPAWINLGGKQ
jgi:hypothetical protein